MPTISPTKETMVLLEMSHSQQRSNKNGSCQIRGYADNSDKVKAEATTSRSGMTEPEVNVRTAGTTTWTKWCENEIGRTDSLTVEVQIKNVGSKTGNIKFKCQSQDNLDKWTLQAYDSASGGSNITSKVFGSGWTKSYTQETGERTVRLEIKPNGAEPGDGFTMEALGDGDNTDSSGVRVTVELSYRPDLHLGMEGQAYIGDDVYDSEGSGQSLLAKSSVSVEYWIRIQNDGDVSDSFVVKAEESGDSKDSWIRRYFDAKSGGTEITDDVQGSGWTTASLASGATKEIRLLAIPSGSTPTGEGGRLTVKLTATSSAKPTKLDAVKMVTQKVTSGSGVRSAVQVEMWRETTGD